MLFLMGLSELRRLIDGLLVSRLCDTDVLQSAQTLEESEIKGKGW